MEQAETYGNDMSADPLLDILLRLLVKLFFGNDGTFLDGYRALVTANFPSAQHHKAVVFLYSRFPRQRHDSFIYWREHRQS